MTAEVDVRGGGELSSKNDLPNGNAIADSSCVFVEVNGNDVGSGDPVGTDLSSTNSVELNGKRVVEESNQSTISNEENEIESEKQESLVLVSESCADQENQLVNLSAKEAELGDQKFEAGSPESGTVMVGDSVDGNGAVSCKNYSSENAESLPTDLPAETACENGAQDMIHEIPVADCPEELGVEIDQNSEEASSPVAVAVAGVDLPLGMQIVRGSVTMESERGLDAGHCQYGVSETVVDDLVDPSQETAGLDKPSDVAESFPSQIDPENLPVGSLKTDPDVAVNVSDTAAKPDASFQDSVVTESSPFGEVHDMEKDNEVGKLNVGSGKGSDSHPVDDAHVNEVGNGPIGEDLVSAGHNSDAKSEIETGFDSVDAEDKVSILASDDPSREPEVLHGDIDGVGERSISVDNAAVESSTSESVYKESTAYVKAEREIENAYVLSFRDVPGNEALVPESEVVSGSVSSTLEDVNVENVGIQHGGGERDDQRSKQLEENVETQFTGEESDDRVCKEVLENGRIQFAGGKSDDQACKEVEEKGGIQITSGESDDKTFQEVEGIQSEDGGTDEKTCKKVVVNGEIKFTGEEQDDKTCPEVKENRGSQFTGGEDGDRTFQDVEGIDGSDRCEIRTSTPEGSTVDASESQNIGVEVVKRPFYFLVKVPRYDDENLREQIKAAQSKVDQKTRSRDAIRDDIQTIRASYKEYAEKLEAAISDERSARESLKSKRQEIDSVQSRINMMKNAISVDDIDGLIRNMEHRIAHETLPLKEEKQIIREIKQLKQRREQISSSIGEQDEVQLAFDQKDQIEEKIKFLRKEADSLRENVIKAEAATQAVKKLHREESEKLKMLLGQFKAADEIRQEAYKNWHSLKKQAYDKNQHFWKYKDDTKQANDLASKGDREALQHLCVNQVERVLELWNNNDEFRKEYISGNIRSTLRRLKTLDGRSLGPDEEAPLIRPFLNDRVAKNISVTQISALGKEKAEQVLPIKSEKVDDKPFPEVRERRDQIAKFKKSAKPSHAENVSATVSGRDDEIEEAKEEVPKLTKEEEEMARKAEEKRKEEAAAKLREQRRLEEKAKAQEALERKKRIAEKAQARAALRAQKEAEQKEKEREKRARKKEKRKADAAEDTAITNEEEYTQSSETPLEVPQTPELRDKPSTATKKPKKASQFTKQAKAKSIPLPLRNRSKRRVPSWMWVLIVALVVFALFLLGNSSFSFKFGLKGSGF